MGFITRLATVGLRIGGRTRLPDSERVRLNSWLEKTAWRFGGLRWVGRLLACLFFGGVLVASTLSSWTFYERASERVYGYTFDTAEELVKHVVSEHVAGYGRPFALHAVLLVFFSVVALLVWLRIGAKIGLQRRGFCWKCGHPLSDLPVNDAAVRCVECGAEMAVFSIWGEAQPRTNGAVVFRPAANVVRVFWTPKRLMRTAQGLTAAALLFGLGWGGWWGFRRVDSNLQARQARAERLSVAEISARLAAGRVAPDASVVRTITIVDEIKAKLEQVQAGQMQIENGDFYDFSSYDPFGTLAEPEARASDKARALVLALRDGALFPELDCLPGTHPWIEKTYLPPEDQSLTNSLRALGGLRVVFRLITARLRLSVVEGDLREFECCLRAEQALVDVALDMRCISGQLIADSMRVSFVRTLHAALRARPDAEWFERVECLLCEPRPVPFEVLVENERVMMIDVVRHHFSDPARIRQGLDGVSGPSFAQAMGEEVRSDVRVGRYRENVVALEATFDRAAPIVAATPWQAERFSIWLEPKSDLRLPVDCAVTIALAIRTMSQARLVELGFRVSVKLARFKFQNGRFPTADEFAARFANEPDAVDPFTGRLFGYRTENLPEAVADRGYLLWSIGADGTDDGGRFDPARPDQALKADGKGTDFPLPEVTPRPANGQLR